MPHPARGIQCGQAWLQARGEAARVAPPRRRSTASAPSSRWPQQKPSGPRPSRIGDQPGEIGDALHKVNLGARPAIALTAGKNHACALLDDGSVKCWGSAENGQLGNGDPTPWLYIGDSPNELGENLKPVALGTAHTATAIAAGEQSTCAVLEDRISVKCWGNGFDGELGNGSNAIIGDNPGEMGDALPIVPLE